MKGHTLKKLYIGMDTHKSSISLAIAFPAKEEAVFYGKISGSSPNVERILRRILKQYNADKADMLICYEAGPCGFVLARRLLQLGFDTIVAAPSLMPQQPGVKVKTDKRDARKIAKLLKDGQITAVHVPDEKDEAVRDLCRARTDAVDDLRRTRQRLGAFLLRNGHIYTGRSNWTEAHMRYLRELVLADPSQKVALEEYIMSIQSASERIQRLEEHMERLQQDWSRAFHVKALQSFRGFQMVAAMVVTSELGDLTRFTHPRKLMGYLGMVPTESSSGSRRRQGSITKCGNSHARWMIVEVAHHYRTPPKVSKELSARQEGLSREIKELSWRAQNRLHRRYIKLKCRHLHENKVVVAVARELVGFIWELSMLLKTQNNKALAA
jgi:transposase